VPLEEKPPQEDCIKYLALKVQDSAYEQFSNVFKKLTLESQGKFFAEVDREGKLLEVLEHLPKDIEEIEIKFHDYVTQRTLDIEIRQSFIGNKRDLYSRFYKAQDALNGFFEKLAELKSYFNKTKKRFLI
jgi:hypothetical protein